jgi:ferredoxin
MERQDCRVTDRRETCLGFGSIAQTVLEGGNGRAIDRSEALAIIRANQEDGLVLQPSNTEESAFICSCCGCCCGMLQLHRSLPRPADFWSSNFFAVVDPSLCNGCGICQRRCQVDAVVVARPKQPAEVDTTRCLGCGQCVDACPQQAIVLRKKPGHSAPPSTREDLHALLKAKRRGPVGKAALAGKLALDMLRTGNLTLLRK